MKRTAAFLLTLAMCLTVTACSTAPADNGTGDSGIGNNGTKGSEISDTLENSNSLVSETAWTAGDESYMVFLDEKNYAWYQTKGVTDDNYFAGTYEFYIGEPALKHLTEDLKDFGVTKEEMQGVFDRNADYSLDNLVCMTVDNESFLLDGVEQLEENKEISYYGFLMEDGTYLDIANMTTGTYYGFTKEASTK